jgi:FKBP-type peptidyl-prolyl cis-trans isomerase FkpA
MRTLLCISSALLLAACASQPMTGASSSSPQAITTASGLVYQSLREGAGAPPKATDVVKVHYRGTFPDGKEFDASMDKPAEFPLNRVIKCWTEGVQMMKPGGKAKLVCPPQIAYGEKGAGGVIPPNATLHFEVELLDVVRK